MRKWNVYRFAINYLDSCLTGGEPSCFKDYVLGQFNHSIYHKVWFDTDPNIRRRILHGMQGLVEMWKYILKQPDCKPGNEDIIATRLLDPSAEDPFDLSHVIPADSGIQLALRVFECLESRHAETQEPDLDGIPLD